MYSTVGFSDFYDGFSDRRENFSYDGLKLLFDYFEDLEDSTGERIEFDPIAICCEYNEYTLEDFNRENCTEFATLDEVLDYVNDRSIVVGLTENTIVYMAF